MKNEKGLKMDPGGFLMYLFHYTVNAKTYVVDLYFQQAVVKFAKILKSKECVAEAEFPAVPDLN